METEKKQTISLHHATQKDVGKYILEELGVPNYVRILFDQSDTVFMFGRLALVRADEYFRFSEIIRRIEHDSGAKVYAVTHDFIEPIGECYSFLCVSKYEEDYEQMFQPMGRGVYRVYAYCYNVACSECSEYGSVFVTCTNDKLVRVG